MPKRKKPDKEFRWTPELAYAIGLIVTDGCLSKDGRHITMRSTEKEQLRNFKKCLNLNNRIGQTESASKISYRVQFGNVQLYNWLLSIGLFPNKTYTLGKINVPNRYFIDFLRGHLDGDGNVMFYVDKYNAYKGRTYTNNRVFIRFISVSEKHILWLHDRTNKVLGLKGALMREKKGQERRVPIWTIKFSKKESLKLIEHLYYQENLPTLSRKKKKALKALQVITNEKRKRCEFIAT